MYRLISGSFLCLVLAAGCISDGAGPAVRVTGSPETLPAPVSLAVEAAPEKPSPEPIDQIKERLRLIRKDELLVVLARIESLSARERVLPKAANWESLPHIVTSLKMTILDTFRGPKLQTVTASYVGGELLDGRWERTGFMPSDPPVGDDYVFFLREIDGEYFLELGALDMLRKDAQGEFRDASGNNIVPFELKEALP